MLQGRDAGVGLRVEALHDLRQTGAVGVGLRLSQSHDLAAVDGGPAVLDLSQATQRLVDGGVGGRGDQHPLATLQQGQHDVAERGGLARAGRAPDEGRRRS